MDQERFDNLTARLATGRTRRHAILSAIAGGIGIAGLATDTDAKRRRKKKKKRRCKRVQAACRSNKECCPGKTGRVCASNDHDVQCRGGGAVCCLPLFSFGCNDDCDCCGAIAACDEPTGQCVAQ